MYNDAAQPYHPPEGPSLWAPATKSDGLHPSQTRHRSPVIPELGRNIGKGKGKAVQDDRRTEERRNTAQLDHALRNDAGRAPEGLRPIRSLETGVIDVSVALLIT
ncbi:hypothetical protein QFC19_001901 [Naganishia cerealis]|uniref:Uncharacterized protein n=1 Tax=Naganishia cerealis TaxID=610337 RepID=A0ACC2WFJ8_9TREE|nr:hypothetical protein QFC19_001901 [Naganishia cerealis]